MNIVSSALRGAKHALAIFNVGKSIALTVAGICVAGIVATTALIAELVGLSSDDEAEQEEAEPP